MLLVHCDQFNIDEFGVEYDIENASLETALVNDSELTSIMYREQGLDLEPNERFRYNKIEGNNFYFMNDESFYEKSTTENDCNYLYYRNFDYDYQKVVQNDFELEFEFAAGIVQAMIDTTEYNLSEFAIKGDFYRINSSYDENKYIHIRVNSKNYIDSLQFYDLDKDDTYAILGFDYLMHNITEIQFPSYDGNKGVETAIRYAELTGFTVTKIDDILTFRNDLYHGEIDLNTYELVVTRALDDKVYTLIWNTSLTFDFDGEEILFESGLAIILADELKGNNIEYILDIINQQEIEDISNDSMCIE
jgi:hypothetical protein